MERWLFWGQTRKWQHPIPRLLSSETVRNMESRNERNQEEMRRKDDRRGRHCGPPGRQAAQAWIHTHTYGHTPFSNLEVPLTHCSTDTLKSHDPGLKPRALVLHSSSLQRDENATILKVVMRKMWQSSLLPRTGSCCFSFWQPPSLLFLAPLKFTFQHQSLLLTGSWLPLSAG